MVTLSHKDEPWTYSVLDQFQKLVDGLGKGLKFTESLAKDLNGTVQA